MAIDFDFYAPEVCLSANAVTEQTLATLGTIPLSSAAFPMQSGRVVLVVADFVCVDSNNYAFGCIIRRVYSTLSTTSYSTNYQLNNPQNTDVAGEGDGSSGVLALASGDLVVYWSNNSPGGSGITQDVSVRVKLRWVGA